MQKILHISPLLLLLLCPPALACLFLTWQQHQARETVKAQLLAGMDASELTMLAFSRADTEALLEWEDEREFEYQGQMYDVVDVAIEGDTIRYRCYRDHEESRLKQALHRLLARPLKDGPATASHTQRLIQFYQSLFCAERPLLSLPTEAEAIRACFFHTTLSGALAGPPPLPPPEV